MYRSTIYICLNPCCVGKGDSLFIINKKKLLWQVLILVVLERVIPPYSSDRVPHLIVLILVVLERVIPQYQISDLERAFKS